MIWSLLTRPIIAWHLKAIIWWVVCGLSWPSPFAAACGQHHAGADTVTISAQRSFISIHARELPDAKTICSSWPPRDRQPAIGQLGYHRGHNEGFIQLSVPPTCSLYSRNMQYCKTSAQMSPGSLLCGFQLLTFVFIPKAFLLGWVGHVGLGKEICFLEIV